MGPGDYFHFRCRRKHLKVGYHPCKSHMSICPTFTKKTFENSSLLEKERPYSLKGEVNTVFLLPVVDDNIPYRPLSLLWWNPPGGFAHLGGFHLLSGFSSMIVGGFLLFEIKTHPPGSFPFLGGTPRGVSPFRSNSVVYTVSGYFKL